ncbi:ATP-binding cassette domain-containing protein [Treponema pedis]|uniref:ABC transporter-like protein n=1 Tax=Treponema pedis str. T A4 TaxID=1291379 RepID=S5ZM37_9SPIR|nr:ABC transporter ATP-binding protein [Treponema pedis]AGT43647.1 ABC transporter-like protein [Treponema pedis str. T A4]QSI04426.1 ABC transporter ATP-binding protein [Treponema pedis]
MRLIKFYLYFFKNYKKEHAILLLKELFISLFIIPIPIGINILYKNNDPQILFYLFISITVWFIFSIILLKKHIQVFLFEPIHIIAVTFYKKFLNAQEKINHGFLIDSFNSNGMMSIEYLEIIAYMLLSFFKLILVITICFFINSKLLIISVIPVLFLIPIQIYFYKHMEEKISNASKTNKTLQNTISEIGNGIETIRKYEASNYFLNQFFAKSKKARAANIKKACGNYNETLLTDMIKTLYIPLFFVFTAFIPFFKIMPEVFLTSLTYIYFITGILYEFIDFVSFVRETAVMTEELVLSFPPQKNISENIENIFPIEFKDFSVHINEKKILNSINLKIDKEEKIAIVGETGSGKTSFLNAIIGGFEPSSGEILFAGKKACQTKNRFGKIAAAEQSPYFFKMSLSENIFFSLKNDTKIEQAMKDAELKLFYEQLEFGGLTRLKPEILSQGEKSRLSVCRINEKEAELILMDETTANLDSETEDKILPKILNRKNTAVLCISHRLSTVMKFKRVLFFKDGKIIYDGAVCNELFSLPFFINLFKEQLCP